VEHRPVIPLRLKLRGENGKSQKIGCLKKIKKICDALTIEVRK
jgi:hypothetical protein